MQKLWHWTIKLAFLRFHTLIEKIAKLSTDLLELERAQISRASSCSRLLFSSLSLGRVDGKLVRAYRALKNIRALLEPHISYFFSSPIEPAEKLKGFAKIWARVVSAIRLIYCQLFFRPGLWAGSGTRFSSKICVAKILESYYFLLSVASFILQVALIL